MRQQIQNPQPDQAKPKQGAQPLPQPQQKQNPARPPQAQPPKQPGAADITQRNEKSEATSDDSDE